jgi:mRNA interferase MazF
MQRGEIWWADLAEPVGSAPGYRRPVLVIQSDWYNVSKLNTVIVLTLSSNTTLGEMPGNVFLPARQTGLPKDSVANITQLVTLDKAELTERVGLLNDATMVAVENGLRQILDLV